MKNYSYDTVREAINGLIKRGYTTDFELMTENECLICHQTSTNLSPDEFEIDEIHRFEGDSDPSDNAILYLIEANDGLIGYSMDVYGAGSNNAEGYDDFIKKIKMEDRDEQEN